MNFHSTTPTEAEAIERRRAFHDSIERHGAQLQSAKLLCAIERQHPRSAPLQPESFPAETDPPAPLPKSVRNRVTIIQRLVSESFGVEVAELISPQREQRACFARMIAMYLCKKLAGQSLGQTGKRFGDRHHTTVLNAFRRIDEMLSLPEGVALSTHWTPEWCDLARVKVAQLRPVILETFAR